MVETSSIRKRKQPKPLISSEHYRQMLVKDGDRRFQNWHTNFLRYQKQFLRQLEQARQR